MIISEIRDRYGVPLGEAKLLTAFNLSLYVAQPVDSYNPEPDIHEELGQIVDFYIGAYKDDVEPNSKVGDSQKASGDKTELAPRAKAHVSPCLRAALAVMRNYYSTAALLAHDSTGRAGDADEERPGLLTEHCERIERLLHAARLTSVATASEEALIGAHPFYPDDIVWLHNERGVAKMMQGDLYEARASFDAAKRFNEEKVEFGYHGPNWLRINLNQLAVDFERGRLQGARSRMDKIDKSLKHEKLAAIVAAYGVPKSPEEESGKLRTVTSSQFTHDEILAAGICTGYRALVDFMAGRLETSRRRFQGACNILRAINEQRAYAFFSLHYSSLLVTLRERDEGQKTAEIAVAAVQASQQLDIANLGQIKEVWLSQWGKSEIPMIENLRKLLGVLEYAASADMYRVRVEARATLAWLKIKSGDYDVALEHAADAMATATRYGMSLRKISLRNLIGEILIKRGDRLSGHALIDKAIQNADRIGYQRAVEQAQDIRLREGRLIDPMMLRLQ
jgi:tetratricopeptide (TPR) repeat protein